ncbi:MAG: hypothetical protein H8D78_20350 [Chloroflexi bacterium]|nr:hypothetical protein [Chloroflexota bacterium]
MAELTLDRPISSLTVGDLLELFRRVMREEQRQECYVDAEGYLVFASEEAYAAYLEQQGGKLPSEVKAYWVNEYGGKCCYSDWEPTPEKRRELDEIRKEPTVPADEVWQELRELGIEV